MVSEITLYSEYLEIKETSNNLSNIFFIEKKQAEIIYTFDQLGNQLIIIIAEGEKVFEMSDETSGNMVAGHTTFENIVPLLRAWKTASDVNNGGGVTSINGATGVVTITKTTVGLGNVDNTSDADKPISTATETSLLTKVDKVIGKGLSENDYTTVEKEKLFNLTTANVVKLTSDFVNSTTTLNPTALFFNAVAGKIYKVEIYGSFQTDTTTTGIRLGISGSAMGDFSGNFAVSLSTNAVATELKSPILSITSQIISTGVSVINVPHIFKAEFIVYCTSAGTIQLSFASEIAASVATLRSNSFLFYQEIKQDLN